jgi:hypothetical protein
LITFALDLLNWMMMKEQLVMMMKEQLVVEQNLDFG